MVNDDVMKLWEETEADNKRLVGEMARVRTELRDTRYRMDRVSSEATSINVLQDIEQREQKDVAEKLGMLEKELKMLAESENMTDQTLLQLKSDNSRLREENKSLVKVISKLSGKEYNNYNQIRNFALTGENSYICKHGRWHSYNSQNNHQIQQAIRQQYQQEQQQEEEQQQQQHHQQQQQQQQQQYNFNNLPSYNNSLYNNYNHYNSAPASAAPTPLPFLSATPVPAVQYSVPLQAPTPVPLIPIQAPTPLPYQGTVVVQQYPQTTHIPNYNYY